MQTLTIIRPDDWHLHVRDSAMLNAVIHYSAQRFGRAVIMPNLVPPIDSVDLALTYRKRILTALKSSSKTPDFSPLMTLYLTADTSPTVVKQVAKTKNIIGFKWYPAGATTHSQFGITNIDQNLKTLESMAEAQVPLLIHGEVTDPRIDIFDREARFIDTVLAPLLHKIPHLKVVLEHITTSEGVAFVKESTSNVAGTLTPHHLLLNRDALFAEGIRPHLYCLPILKRERHRQALITAATSGDASFFLGTDSAPHTQKSKESACGCAGIFSAHIGIELYAEVFDKSNALDKLEGFASLHGPAFYGLPPNPRTITLQRRPQKIIDKIAVDDDFLVPFRAGETMAWSIKQTAA